jgi:hypothetical protein
VLHSGQDKRRRNDAVVACPRQFLLLGVAAAIPPAGFRIFAAAGTVHAGIGFGRVLLHLPRQGNSHSAGSQSNDSHESDYRPETDTELVGGGQEQLNWRENVRLVQFLPNVGVPVGVVNWSCSGIRDGRAQNDKKGELLVIMRASCASGRIWQTS